MEGFNALPGGYRDIITNNAYQWMGTHAYFWTSTVDGNSSQAVTFRYIHGAAIYKFDYTKIHMKTRACR